MLGAVRPALYLGLATEQIGRVVAAWPTAVALVQIEDVEIAKPRRRRFAPWLWLHRLRARQRPRLRQWRWAAVRLAHGRALKTVAVDHPYHSIALNDKS